jgi:hypothetical protein
MLHTSWNEKMRTKENFGRNILNLGQASNICLFHDRIMTSKENSRKYIPTEKKRKRLIDGFCNTAAKTNKKIETW